MFKSFTNALFPQIHTQSNYDFSARDARDKLTQSKIQKPDNKYSEMGVGERTKKGEPAPGQGAKITQEIGEPSEPSDMSPEQKEQLGGQEPTSSGKSKSKL
ncbi:protein of unknown function [Taphrina deformans PYCC 5710]|uniref:Uncharacterized protein n=1 Tax=Taphrina deformans (strain PYCC 5710 / ATCC 11124 / CBS 356.35 / IMI 108563 / JCM 9778 / NBRC 8474) TaxID=1097556 RepID=R4XF49_TAPDE|nr:protein of unknown function [Taphrina deformans PYCC 5710]|eukprot:CCG84273.1 protein of unknown function [Taphrina deformans PYCC 5710]